MSGMTIRTSRRTTRRGRIHPLQIVETRSDLFSTVWSLSSDSNTCNSNIQTRISMSFDRMGRRVVKNDLRFIYDGYLQIANFEHQTSNIKLQTFIWNPTEPIATRPLVWLSGDSPAYYVLDGNKNVSEVIATDGSVSGHYEYAPFGALNVSCGDSAATNPWRFSSEYAEDDTATVYYNYRHYEPTEEKWLSRDPLGENYSKNAYSLMSNSSSIDLLGLLHFDMDCKIKDECKKDILSLLDGLSHFIGQLSSAKDKDESYRRAVQAYETLDNKQVNEMPSDWDSPDEMKDKLLQIKKELEKKDVGVEVFCCKSQIKDPRLKEMCENTASAYGRGATVPVRYQGRIVVCPDGMADVDRYGGCACLMFHEVMHKLGFYNDSVSKQQREEVNKANKSRNTARENGMIRLARIILGRRCNGYDTW